MRSFKLRRYFLKYNFEFHLSLEERGKFAIFTFE